MVVWFHHSRFICFVDFYFHLQWWHQFHRFSSKTRNVPWQDMGLGVICYGSYWSFNVFKRVRSLLIISSTRFPLPQHKSIFFMLFNNWSKLKTKSLAFLLQIYDPETFLSGGQEVDFLLFTCFRILPGLKTSSTSSFFSVDSYLLFAQLFCLALQIFA